MKSILQSEKKCYITGSTYNLHRHHIFAGGRRQLSEREGFWVYLIGHLHNQSNDGVHGKNGHALDLQLKQDCQRKYEETHSREEWMLLMGKSYL
jgi:hypothetical protein